MLIQKNTTKDKTLIGVALTDSQPKEMNNFFYQRKIYLYIRLGFN